MADDGEPMAPGRRDRHAAETRAFRNAVLFGVVLGIVAIINAVLGVMLIDVFESLDSEAGMPVMSRRFLGRAGAASGGPGDG